VSVIDGASNRVLGRIPVDAYPTAFCLNPVQNRVYVANLNGSSISVLRDSGSGVDESLMPEKMGSMPLPTIVRDVLYLPEAAGRNPRAAWLLDISGRRVLDLRPGANDVGRLPTGVYFVKHDRAQPVILIR
jgi:hypothetical protein